MFHVFMSCYEVQILHLENFAELYYNSFGPELFIMTEIALCLCADHILSAIYSLIA